MHCLQKKLTQIPTEFYENLHALLSQHLPLCQAIALLQQTSTEKALKRSLGTLQHHLNRGLNFTQSMAHTFPQTTPYELYIIKLGVNTQQLTPCLKKLLEHRQHKKLLQSQLYQTAFYPCLTLLLAIIIGCSLLLEVLPGCLALYQQQHTHLPPLTAHLLLASQWLHHWYLFIPPTVCLTVSSFHHLLKLPFFQSLTHKYHLHIPILYAWLMHRRYSNLCHMLHLCLLQQLPLTLALQYAADAQSHRPTRSQINRLRQHINNGHPLASALHLTPNLPKLLTQWIHLSNNTQHLAKSMMHLSQIFTQHAEKQAQTLQRWLNPLLLCLASVIIGIIMMAIYLPIFQLGQVF